MIFLFFKKGTVEITVSFFLLKKNFFTVIQFLKEKVILYG